MSNTINLEEEINSQFPTITNNGSDNKSIKKFLLIGAVALATLGATVYLGMSSDNQPTVSKSTNAKVNVETTNTINQENQQLSEVSNTSDVITPNTTIESVIQKKENSFPIFENSNLVNESNKAKLNEAGNFDLPSNLADNQVARKVAQIKFSDENYFLSLVSEGEGFRSSVYNDNIGFAFGNGWNISMQSKSYNENLAKIISNDNNYITKISSLSGNVKDRTLSSDYSSVKIAPQRSMQIAEIMGERFEPGVIRGIAKQLPKNVQAQKIHKETGKSYEVIAQNLYDNLQPNEKAAVLYHSYKVGEAGFAKYTNMIGSLTTYALSDNKTEDMKKKVADGFTYKYKMNGEVKQDTRAEVIVSSMFADKEAFGYLVGKNVAPRNFASLSSSINKSNIDTSVAPGEVVIPDPVGEERARLEKLGTPINIELMPVNTVQENIKNIRESAQPKPKKSLPYGYY